MISLFRLDQGSSIRRTLAGDFFCIPSARLFCKVCQSLKIAFRRRLSEILVAAFYVANGFELRLFAYRKIACNCAGTTNISLGPFEYSDKSIHMRHRSSIEIDHKTGSPGNQAPAISSAATLRARARRRPAAGRRTISSRHLRNAG
jgi:hypothetical protein